MLENPIIYNSIAIGLTLLILFGIYLMSSPKTAVRGNAIGMYSLGAAVVIALVASKGYTSPAIWVAIIAGAAVGLWIAKTVKMIQMPQLVAMLNGLGGASAAIVAIILLVDPTTTTPSYFAQFTAALALVIGMITLSGSWIAAAKLHQIMGQKPIILRAHASISSALLGAMALAIIITTFSGVAQGAVNAALLFILSTAFGIILTIRVGGADMPITISLLISFSGLAGAVAGLALLDTMLVAIGGMVGASGLILTQIMCRAMNRKLVDILFAKSAPAAAKTASPASSAAKVGAPAATSPAPAAQANDIATLLNSAKSVLIIPGYGMALAQAQHKVKLLADKLQENGAKVAFAIHPVAGRMPGHMNVLLAEANVDYEQMLEMDAINPEFPTTDLVIVVGANDVINPAAIEAEGTPIYGMPILHANKAKNLIICNYDDKAGYAGVPNPLYTQANVTMMLGDAAVSIETLISKVGLTTASSGAATSTGSAASATDVASLLSNAKRVLIIPGYGMALAQAQHKVKLLADKLESNGATVDFAIHPVAGRMPGHMNVLLAEANVDYEKLLEMDAVNPEFPTTDLVIVVGANDVINPAAIEAEGTPIYGMPILHANKAKNLIICNYDDKPGYAGVPNPLYTQANVVMMLGDAATSVDTLINGVSAASAATAVTSSAPDFGSLLANAKRVLIIPGYGMALAQAQHKVKLLADKLESNGAKVDFAIHPVAGRMPGHMNVLLAEANVDYEQLLEMDAINPEFPTTDLVIVVGANDVINPAAIEAEGTPIYGMPILHANKAKNLIICNYDDKPGYAGVPNPLYTQANVVMMLGDAATSVDTLINNVPAK